MLALSICIALIAIVLTYYIMKMVRNVSYVKDMPHFYQPLSPLNILLLLNIVPAWICSYEFRYIFDYTWQRFHKKLESDVVACVTPQENVYIIADADIAKEITSTQRESFPKPDMKRFQRFGPNIASEEGMTWRRHRKIAAQGFTERNNKLVVQETARIMDGVVAELESKANMDIDILSYTNKIALSVICSTAFGMTCEWEETKEYDSAGDDMTFFQSLKAITTHRILAFIAPQWLLGLPFKSCATVRKALEVYFTNVKRKIEEAKEELEASQNYTKSDLFSILIRTTKDPAMAEEGELTLTDEELLGNVFVFLLAGHETTAHAMSFCLGLIALHQDVQDELYQEILTHCGDGKVTYEDVASHLKFATAVMNESLRLVPIAPMILRSTTSDVRVDKGNLFIPAHSKVSINFLGIQTNEKYWGSDATEFKPHRFLDNAYNKDAFLPFSDGPRGCLGRRFAQLEMLTAIATIVKHFHVSPADPNATMKTLIQPEVVMKVPGVAPMMLKLTPRS